MTDCSYYWWTDLTNNGLTLVLTDWSYYWRTDLTTDGLNSFVYVTENSLCAFCKARSLSTEKPYHVAGGRHIRSNCAKLTTDCCEDKFHVQKLVIPLGRVPETSLLLPAKQPCASLVLCRQHLWCLMTSSCAPLCGSNGLLIFPYATLVWPLVLSPFPVEPLPFRSRITFSTIFFTVHYDA